jgi:hypothetical protein
VRDPTADIAVEQKRIEDAVAEACELLRPLAKPARSRSVINWNDPDAPNDPRDKFEAAAEFVIALLDPAIPTSSAQEETYDRRAQHAADEFLGVHASIVRKVVLPALRLGRPPKRKGPRGNLLWNRWIAAVVTTICRRHGLKPYRNPTSKHACGCSVVAEALDRLGMGLSEKSVARIYAEHGQA